MLELVDSISAFQEIFEMVFDVGLFLFFYRKAEGEDFGGIKVDFWNWNLECGCFNWIKSSL